MIEDQPKKSRIALAMLPYTGKIVKLILTVMICACLAGLASLGADTLNAALEEMDPMIESGALPECIKKLVQGYAMITMTGILGLYFLVIRK